ncbi:MAG: serine/threonine-protein kinase HipA [Mucilaginibacter sp.]|nr:serine/threonine-protein kinase HipA [Mucilaginibacter sp.]
MSKRGMVYYQDRLAGIVAETDEGYEFTYDTEYLNNETAKPISLTLPLSKKTYTDKVLFAFFDGLIPEGWLLNLATDHWKVKRNDRFELLLLTCRDTIGAVTIIPENE